MDDDDDKAILTIYTDKYDSLENVANGGMSGKAFIDNLPGGTGMGFNDLDRALNVASQLNLEIGRIDFHYLDENGQQMFWKIDVANGK